MSKTISGRLSRVKKSTALIISGILFLGAAAGIGLGATSLALDPDVVNGVNGKDGAPGRDGADGTNGKDGLPGKDGTNGIDGNDGANGKDGADGTDGKDGANGKDGVDGTNGKDGPPGKDGKDGVDGNDGADGQDGKDGADGKDGPPGKDGKDGVDGKDGADGIDGADGNKTIGTNWNSTTVADPTDSSKKLNVLRINKEVTTEAQLNEVYNDLIAKNIDRTTIDEIHLPYHLKNTITEEKVKDVLHMRTFNNNNIGYILHEEDYDQTVAEKSTSFSGGYTNLKLVEVNLPKTIEILPRYTFSNNKIKKVNWEELTNLKRIGNNSFSNNRLTGDLDLSYLTSLFSIGSFAFINNSINGTLLLPPNITTIEERSFNSISSHTNKISGILKLPKSLVSIGLEAFAFNSIEELDWSKAESLEYIQDNAFVSNKIKTLEFDTTTPPKLKTIGATAFSNNQGINDKNEMFSAAFKLPESLETIGNNAIKVTDGVYITVSANGRTGITVDSFEGIPRLTRLLANPEADSSWKSVVEVDPVDSTKQLKVLRIDKLVRKEEHLKEAYDNMVSKNVDVSSFDKLYLPYHLKNTVTEGKIKEALHMTTLDSGNIGYIFHETDYDETVAKSGDRWLSGGFKNQKIVEVNLPKDIETLPDNTFATNKIKKVNWSELTNLKSIGSRAFYYNNLTGFLDLSVLTSLTSIGEETFVRNAISGTLSLPPNIITIGKHAFNSSVYGNNSIKGRLILPKTLKTIGEGAFIANAIATLDWSDAQALEEIKASAFSFNDLKTLEFSTSTPPSLKTIGASAFFANTGLDNSRRMFINDVVFPPSLQTIGQFGFKVKDGIKITVSAPATGINDLSFQGVPKITRR